MIFNIVITKRKRDRHISKCLHYLNNAAKQVVKKNEINVYVMYDDVFKNDLKLNNINIFSHRVNLDQKKPFCKTILLNKAHEKMTQFYDILITLDNDIIVKKDFFKQILTNCKATNMVFLGGLKLNQVSTEKILNSDIDHDLIFEKNNEFGEISPISVIENSQQAYIGNIALHYKMVEQIKNITNKNKLYDDRFIGFGGEDSVLSFLSMDLMRTGLAKRIYLPDAWRHLYHERNTDNPYYKKNVNLMNTLINYNRNKIRKIIQK